MLKTHFLYFGRKMLVSCLSGRKLGILLALVDTLHCVKISSCYAQPFLDYRRTSEIRQKHQ